MPGVYMTSDLFSTPWGCVFGWVAFVCDCQRTKSVIWLVLFLQWLRLNNELSLNLAAIRKCRYIFTPFNRIAFISPVNFVPFLYHYPENHKNKSVHILQFSEPKQELLWEKGKNPLIKDFSLLYWLPCL